MGPRTRLSRTGDPSRSAATLQRGTSAANGGLQSAIGNRATVALLAAGQAKLVVGGATDRLEVEADAVADQVTSGMQSPSVARESEADELEEEEAPVQRMADSVQRMFGSVQREAGPIGPEGGDVTGDTESTINAARSGGGSPLPGGIRGRFESAFGADFGGVRVHQGAQSESLNREVGARAFTVGSDIFLGPSAPQAESSEGKHLLAHELTHTIQQGASRPHRPEQ